MKFIKQFIIYSLLGIGLGNFFHLLSHNLSATDYVTSFSPFREMFSTELAAINAQNILYAVVGIIQGFSSNIFKTDKNLLVQTLSHYSIILTSLILLNLFILGGSSLIIILTTVNSIYIIVYIFMYLYRKYEIKKINSKL
ncbi:MAG: DUF3021 family protein [Gemella sp.]|nr:DUF3021 family protein [Gemella sp.]